MKCKNNQFRYIYINQYFSNNEFTKLVEQRNITSGHISNKKEVKRMNRKKSRWVNANNYFYETKKEATVARKEFHFVDTLNQIYIPAKLLKMRTAKIAIKII